MLQSIWCVREGFEVVLHGKAQVRGGERGCYITELDFCNGKSPGQRLFVTLLHFFKVLKLIRERGSYER